MTSHEYAEKLMEVVRLLQTSPEFEVMYEWPVQLSFWSEKDKFLAAVRAVGAGEKRVERDDLKFISVRAPLLNLMVQRNLLCVKVQEEKWECQPLLTVEEEASIG